MDWNLKWKPAADYLERDLGDEILLMSQDGQVLHSLDGVGLDIWNQIKQNRSMDEILPFILNEYDVDREQLKKDLEVFIDELIAAELVSSL